MKRTKVIIIIGVAIVILTLTAYYFVFKKKEIDSSTPTSSGCSDYSNQNNNTAAFPLKQGSKGLEVKNLQKYLNKIGNAGLCIDGIWGSLTQEAFEKSSLPGVKNGIAPPINQVTSEIYNSKILKAI